MMTPRPATSQVARPRGLAYSSYLPGFRFGGAKEPPSGPQLAPGAGGAGREPRTDQIMVGGSLVVLGRECVLHDPIRHVPAPG